MNWRKYARSKAGRLRQARADRMYKHGVTQEMWDTMLLRCVGRCEICGTPFQGKGEPRIDHDHKTGRVRGLLCHLCNIAAERLDNIPDWCRKAHRYMRRKV